MGPIDQSFSFSHIFSLRISILIKLKIPHVKWIANNDVLIYSSQNQYESVSSFLLIFLGELHMLVNLIHFFRCIFETYRQNN